VGTGPVLPGEQVQIVLRMSDIPPASPAAGFQAFLRFNSTQMTFVSGAYTPSPFGLHILNPITAAGPDINLAAGINTFTSQLPSAANADLATLTFQVNTSCGVGAVEFRTNLPPTRLTDADGSSILPLALIDLNITPTCPADVHQDAVVNVTDLLLVIGNWGTCPPTPLCCPGNTNGDGSVNVTDLLAVIGAWGACP
jgi:hypothetical protein